MKIKNKIYSPEAKDLNSAVITKLQHNMISKNFVLILLATILTLSFASALTIDSHSFLSTGSASINVGNNYNESLAVSIVSSVNSGYTFSVTPTTFELVNGSNPQALSISLTGVPSGLTFGTYPVATLSATSNVSSQNSTSTISYVKSFCKNGTVNEANLSIRNIDISNNGNGKDNEWDLLDTITIDVEVEAGDIDVDNVEVQMGLFDSSGKNVVNDLDFMNADEETFDVGDLNDGDKETATFEFKVPADIDTSSYKLVFKAYSTDAGESVICDDNSGDLSDNTYESISVNEADDKGMYIIFDDIKATPAEVTCGDSVSLDANVFNVGKDDEDKVKVHLINTDLNIDQTYELVKGLDRGDNSRVSFAFTVPSNVVSKTYALKLSSEYDYRNGIYRQDSDEDTSVSLKVIGCSSSTVKTTGITVNADDAVAGKEYTVTATIKNLGNSSATFLLDASNYNSWATLKDVSDSSVTLAAGQSRDVTFTFDVKSDASGDNSFSIISTVNGNTEVKQVPVTVTSSSSLNSIFKGNSLVWVIGLINLILIILIIVVAVKVARR